MHDIHSYSSKIRHAIKSDDALLVSQDGVVDDAGDGAHGRPEGGVVLQALHRDSPELQVDKVRYGSAEEKLSCVQSCYGLRETLTAPAGGY